MEMAVIFKHEIFSLLRDEELLNGGIQLGLISGGKYPGLICAYVIPYRSLPRF